MKLQELAQWIAILGVALYAWELNKKYGKKRRK